MSSHNPTAVASKERMLRIARHLIEGGDLDAHWIMRTCGVSEAVANRDMVHVRLYLPVTVRRARYIGDERRHYKIRLINRGMDA